MKVLKVLGGILVFISFIMMLILGFAEWFEVISLEEMRCKMIPWIALIIVGFLPNLRDFCKAVK